MTGPAAAKKRTARHVTRMQKDHAMTASFRNFALQIAITLALTSVLGVALLGFADYATKGVIA